MRGVLTLASRLESGDVVLEGEALTVERTTGSPGRRPKNAAPLMRVIYDTGAVAVMREDQPVRIQAKALPLSQS